MTLNEIYNELANRFIDQIKNEWFICVLEIRRQDKMVEFGGYYFDLNKNKHLIDISLGYAESKMIHEIHSITTAGGHNRWNKAKFSISNNGKFDMEYIWDQSWQDDIDKLNK